MSYTPGPWTIQYSTNDYEGNLIYANRAIAATATELGHIEATPEDEANARLIAAAPDLLAALTRLHHALSDIINASDNCECGARDSGDYCKCPLGSGPYKPVELQDGSGPKSFMADCNLAYAAIAKATTGQEEEL